jgi:hypothetical protein
MEPESKFLCGQETANSVLGKINPIFASVYFLKIHFIIILPSTPTSHLFSSDFSIKILSNPLFSISFFLIWWPTVIFGED